MVRITHYSNRFSAGDITLREIFFIAVSVDDHVAADANAGGHVRALADHGNTGVDAVGLVAIWGLIVAITHLSAGPDHDIFIHNHFIQHSTWPDPGIGHHNAIAHDCAG